jgi:hypothetical protein
MKYGLFVYVDESWDQLPAEERRGLHAAHRGLHNEHHASAAATVHVIGHYRLRPPAKTTTVRRIGDEIAKTQGPSAPRREALRALYLLESDDPDAILDLAARLPALRIGGTAELWPLIEPKPDGADSRAVSPGSVKRRRAPRWGRSWRRGWRGRGPRRRR